MSESRRLRACMVAAATLAVLVSASALLAEPDRIPGQATVCVARQERVFFDPTAISSFMYPEGKLDFNAVERMVDEAVGNLTELRDPVRAWGAMVKPVDVVGILADVRDLPVHLVMVDVVVQKLLRAGIKADNIIIFAGDEGDLFNAGFAIRRTGPGIRCIGSATVGYRGGTSRIVLDDCTALVSVSRLRVDRQIGLSGAIANHLACAPMSERLRLLTSAPGEIGELANRPIIRRKVLLHIVDAIQPAYDFREGRKLPPRWDYRGVMVSRDPVALDAIGASLLEKYRAKVKGAPWPLSPQPGYIADACKLQALGQSDLAQITLIKSGYEAGGLL